ncbi:MAG TPA: hypothetical protein VFL97_11150 [Nitrococcus sp.]|nr:hypothetical protein [Nitrococcus sp.]
MRCSYSNTHLARLVRRTGTARPSADTFGEEAAKELLHQIKRLEDHGTASIHKAVENAALELQQGPRSNYFECTRSRLNRSLTERSGLTSQAAARYHIKAWGWRPRIGYGLDLPPKAIHVEGEP